MNERRSLWKDQNEWAPDPDQPALTTNSFDCSMSTSDTSPTHRKKQRHAMRACARKAAVCTFLVTDQITRPAATTSARAATDSEPTARDAIEQTPNSWKEERMEEPPPTGAGPESTGTDNEQKEALAGDGPRICVASLSDYNAGILHGAWIAADQTPEEFYEEVHAMLDRSPTRGAEEFAIHDYEGFGHYAVGEYDSLEWISTVACGISEQGLAFAAWVEACDRDPDRVARFEEAFRGNWESVEAYADELLSDLGYAPSIDAAAPEWLQPYINFNMEAFARDLELNGHIVAVRHADGVWIFDGGSG
jgi:antirestriction protein